MRISKIRIKNWRNFRDAEISELSDVVYVLGPNASGKSNVLDAIRFLRDIAKSRGGGLQEAVETRGGLSKIRCLHARKDTEVLIDVELSEDNEVVWGYCIGFNIPGSGFYRDRRPVITQEIVTKFTGDHAKTLLMRPDANDRRDALLLQQSHLEQVNSNKEFRDLVDFFGGITYHHLVPQLLKFGDQISGRTIENDPFGQEFLLRISGTSERTRTARLSRIEGALQKVVPHMEDLRFVKDEVSGRPHLEIKFKHHRPRGAKQREDQFSDGTLRLISLLWLLQETSDSPLLLEEPELSLNEEVVRQLSYIMEKVMRRRGSSAGRQVFITTHSYALLSNPGIDPAGLVVIQPSEDGSKARKTTPAENAALAAGLSPAEAVLPTARRLSSNFQLSLEL